MAERPIKKSERQELAKSPENETSSPKKRNFAPPVKAKDRDKSGTSDTRSSDTRSSDTRQERDKGKRKGKGKGKDRGRDSKPAPVNLALVRGPRPGKVEPPKEEEVLEASTSDEETEAT
ncbi:MAG: hypothetical protein AAFQ57_12035, partial [Cyanobacteria bacterium J06626_14]